MALTIDHSLNSVASSSGVFTIDNTGSIIVPKGSTAQRPGSPQQGAIRYNTDSGDLEVYDSTLNWQSLQTGAAAGAADDAIVYSIVLGS